VEEQSDLVIFALLITNTHKIFQYIQVGSFMS
jgi:hypothetical protein